MPEWLGFILLSVVCLSFTVGPLWLFGWFEPDSIRVIERHPSGDVTYRTVYLDKR